MGTSSMIGVYNQEDGSVTATYCHYDGYLSYNGRLLSQSYNTPEKAAAVANAGYLSGLTEHLDVDLENAVHKDEKPVVYNSVKTFLTCGDNHCGADFLYLFDGEAWFFTDTYAKRKMRRFEEVEMNLEGEAA
jgi:hypothetical protein